MLTFKELKLAAPILKAISDVGYEIPSPVQAESIPAILAGRDLLGQAQTGTGKTAAFALPVLSGIDHEIKLPQVLVLAPTRELAIQVAESFQKYAKHLEDFHILPIYGGADIRQQLRALKRGVQVVVGTPGRVMDHLERKSLDLSHVSTIVLDEADEMLKMGFIDDVEWILKHAPDNCQKALFSATMPRSIQNIANNYLKDPVKVKIKAEKQQVSTIKKLYTVIPRAKKVETLLDFLEVEETNAVIIFTRTKIGSTEVADKLEARGFRASAINGDMRQDARERVIKRIKDGSIDIVVATEVAARGLDVERISYVINYDMPHDVESFVHRIGRTGRAGREGTSLLFVEPKETRMLRSFERSLNEKLEEVFPPSKKQLQKKRKQKLALEIQEALKEDLDDKRALIQNIMHDLEVTELDVAAGLLSLIESQNSASESKANEQPEAASGDLVPYRISVGKQHQVMPKDIVGALTNEAGIDYNQVGRISILRQHSIVDLPASMPKSMIRKLEKLTIKNNFVEIYPVKR